ncbi:MAG: hypothetical protein HDR00_10530 [Lachnospiraceae bacterium]|nr:hypothetical protein [Lachnospiraceae bacterium]
MNVIKEGAMLLIFAAYIIILFVKQRCEKAQYAKAAVISAGAILIEVIFDILPYYILELDAFFIAYSVIQWTVTNIVFILAVGMIYRLSCKELSKLRELYGKSLPAIKIGVVLMLLLGMCLTFLNCYYLLASMRAMEEALKGGNSDFLSTFSAGNMRNIYVGILRIFKILIPGCLMMDFICRKDGSVAK